jgi:hypothetical protein
MHAYLIVSKNAATRENKTVSLLTFLKIKRFDAIVNKIDDVRALASFTKLGQKEPIAIVVGDIENASLEALNALLKNLEEPQDNIKYILTAHSLINIPQTIISRCEILKAVDDSDSKASVELTSEFIAKSFSSKINYISDIRTREEAQDFAEKMIVGAHSFMAKGKNIGKYSKIVKSADTLFSAIKSNANITLQLLNFTVNI